mgnify:FL=1
MALYHGLGSAELYKYLYDEDPRSRKSLNKKSIRTILSRMKNKGLLKNKERQWSITAEGKELLKGRNSDIRRFFPSEKQTVKKAAKNLIIIFDIPEKQKRYREWLRSELILFGFDMVQKSVWLGPALSQEFIEYLNEIRLLKHIRFFSAEEKDLI